MDESLKVILSKHWPTLIRYINPTAALIGVLVDDRVLPSAMIDDIQRGSTRREKNEILLKSIKLRGNTSYRKFRDAMMKCGQIFIADLLYEEEGPMSFVEESDFSGFPAFKLSLSPSALRQFALHLDAKIRARVLKNEWKADSTKRMELLVNRSEDEKCQIQATASAQEKEEKIKQLSAELNVKNDIIRSLSLDINILNSEVETFIQRYASKRVFSPDNDTKRTTPMAPITPTGGSVSQSAPPSARGNNNNMEASQGDALDTVSRFDSNNQQKRFPSRFSFFDKALSLVNSKLSSILGLPESAEEEMVHIDILDGRASQIHEMVSKLEESLRRMTKDRDVALGLLMPNTQQKFPTVVAGVQRHLLQEQRHRVSLLKDIDRLSRKLRGMTVSKPNSGLMALRQSAVTGNPAAEIVDYRFLSNHISLLEADAEHIRKKLDWKETDVKTLQANMAHLKGITSSIL